MGEVLFALRYCEKYIDEMEHKDIDDGFNMEEEICDEEWLSFSQKCDRLWRKTDEISIPTNDLDKLQVI